MLTAIRRRATTRNVIAAFLALSAVTLISHLLAVPAYHAFASGLDPMNLQYRLTREMVAIQRGAFSAGTAPAYLAFAVLDTVWQWSLVVFLTLLWAWIMDRSPEPLIHDVLLLFPILPALFGIAESVGFFILVSADSHYPLHDFTGKVLLVHSAKNFLREGDIVITVCLVIYALYYRWRHPPNRAAE